LPAVLLLIKQKRRKLNMNLNIRFFILLSFLIILNGCKKDENNPTTPTVGATEQWKFIMNNDSANHGQATIAKKSDGSISSDADWYFVEGGYTVHCPYENGDVTIIDTLITMTGEGTAYNPNPHIPQGYDSSSFTINVNGSANSGKMSGTWSIDFTQYGWPPNLQGTFTGTRISGSGVTK
jgi:hypothetical protein